MSVTSDVYSLGVLLYRLLTGESPYGAKRRGDADLTRAICEETPVRPSVAAPVERRRPLKSELDAIVLKALRKEPERRYASVQDFSEDVRRHLEGRPVSARKDTVGYRAGRFVHRHPWGIASAALVLVTLISATAITARQARIAEQRFNQVRTLANAVLFDYHDAIAALPGSTPIRERMVKDALRYLDTLSAESSGDATLQRELASAYEKVGDVQGSPSRANLGNFAGALASHGKASGDTHAPGRELDREPEREARARTQLRRARRAVAGHERHSRRPRELPQGLRRLRFHLDRERGAEARPRRSPRSLRQGPRLPAASSERRSRATERESP